MFFSAHTISTEVAVANVPHIFVDIHERNFCVGGKIYIDSKTLGVTRDSEMKIMMLYKSYLRIHTCYNT